MFLPEPQAINIVADFNAKVDFHFDDKEKDKKEKMANKLLYLSFSKCSQRVKQARPASPDREFGFQAGSSSKSKEVNYQLKLHFLQSIL